ncbi:hypothetical protein ACFOYW_09750 [Gryllotalpicola reticulitermitis]|uniref:C2H2-type domain-containing protein n=1 Tax=Gryllotalpicola reticulitermitis TaxID=1184153 RepID=A0ABV8Q5H6_9MICO
MSDRIPLVLGSGVMRATGVAVLSESDGSAETAVLLFTEVAPDAIIMDWKDRGARGYRRLRRGALAHGMPEPYADDQRALRDPAALDISRHRALSITGGRPTFAASDVIVLVPADADRLREIRVPVSSAEKPLEAVYLSASADIDTFQYERTARVEDAETCPVCGKLMRAGGVHEASHGVPGHRLAGTRAGDEHAAGPERAAHQPRLDDPSVFRHTL